MSAAAALEGFLGEHYHHAVRGRPAGALVARLRDAVAADDELAAAARRRLAALEELPPERCVISHIHRDFLRRILGGSADGRG